MPLIMTKINEFKTNKPIITSILLLSLLQLILSLSTIVELNYYYKEAINTFLLIIFAVILLKFNLLEIITNKILEKGTILKLTTIFIIYESFIARIYLNKRSLLIMPQSEVVHNGNYFEIIIVIFCFIILSPAIEELIFRGSFYTMCRQKYNIFASITYNSILFLTGHGFSIRSIFTIIIPSIIWTLTYEKSKNIIFPISMHIFHNLIYFIIAIYIK